MKSLQISIYKYEEVLYTLAWLSGCKIDASPKKVISRATQLGLVEVHNDKHWKANERNIFRRLENPKIAFPHHNQIEDLTKILIGLQVRCFCGDCRILQKRGGKWNRQ